MEADAIRTAEEPAGVRHRTTRSYLGGEIYREFTADGTYRMGGGRDEVRERPATCASRWRWDRVPGR
jgi:hypothetical protein